jgi:ABC-2 type transport system ATP-binding protein
MTLPDGLRYSAGMIALRGIRKVFADGTVALRGVDLEIGQGLFGLLGPNGAGKTTLLSILVLALEPTSGSRSYDGVDAGSPARRRRLRGRIGFLPQDFAPLAHLTGREYVAHCGRLRCPGLNRQEVARRTREVLAAVDLSTVADRLATTYSGGMRRRLGIAQALIHRPDVLVVDEPTAGLDPEERIRFRNLIAEIGVSSTVILSTHIVEDIEATCPRIGVVAAGEMLFDGTPTELLRRIAGRLWLAPPGVALPAGALDLGAQGAHDAYGALGAQAAGLAGTATAFVAAGPVSGALSREPSLELAYRAFLAGRAIPAIPSVPASSAFPADPAVSGASTIATVPASGGGVARRPVL